jgi:hypothetical protein
LDSDPIQADQIADYDFQWLKETLSAVQRTLRRTNRSENLILAADLELTNGERVFLRVEVKDGAMADQPQLALLNRIGSSTGFPIRLRGGGYAIVNPSNLMRLTIYPLTDMDSKEVAVG